MKTYCCIDTPESILTAIYDAWASDTPNRDIKIEYEKDAQFSLFTDYTSVTPSYEKADKVMRSIRRDLGEETFHFIEGALCANDMDKPNAIFQFLRYAFRLRKNVTRNLANEEVLKIFELNRKSRNEAHLLTGFVRFEELTNGVYYSKIGPVNDVLSLIADHFSERFNSQAFLIYDEKRKKSVVYTPGTHWYFLEGELDLENQGLKTSDRYEKMWQMYFDTIAIKKRLNPVCQRSHCPIHFREYMTEFHA